MAILVDEGKMGWDDPVRKHLSYFHLGDPLADRKSRLRDLVCHRTGLAPHDLLWYRSPWPPEEVVRRAGLLPLDQPFRTRFQYQSTMFTAAGLAVGSAAGQPWQEFVQKRLFDPLGMTASCFTSTAAAKAADRAVGHRLNRLGRPEVVDYYPEEVPDPAGSIHSTARDLAQWAIFQLGDGRWAGRRIVSAANLAETHTPQMVIRLEGIERDLHPETVQMSYGMGWVLEDYRGVGLCSHAGAIDGFRAHITLIPEKKIGIVLLNNLQSTRMNLALSNSLVDLLLGLPRKDWNGLCAEAVRKDEAAAAEKARRARIPPRPRHQAVARAGRLCRRLRESRLRHGARDAGEGSAGLDLEPLHARRWNITSTTRSRRRWKSSRRRKSPFPLNAEGAVDCDESVGADERRVPPEVNPRRRTADTTGGPGRSSPGPPRFSLRRSAPHPVWTTSFACPPWTDCAPTSSKSFANTTGSTPARRRCTRPSSCGRAGRAACSSRCRGRAWSGPTPCGPARRAGCCSTTRPAGASPRPA